MKQNQTITNGLKRRGLTLIELMVVIGILVALTAIAIPAVRMINRDRKVREGAREVNAMLSSARDTAVVNGFAGVEFVRNGNFVDADGVNYAVTAMYRIKMPRVYAGDLVGASITELVPGIGTFTCVIPDPANPGIIRVNDYLRLGYRGPLYRITGYLNGTPAAGSATLTCEVLPHLPVPAAMTAAANPQGIGFQVFRQPVRDERSRVELPRGLYIDMRLSGALDNTNLDANANTFTAFGLAGLNALPPALAPGENRQLNSVVVMFDSTGAVDRIYPNGLTGAGTGIHPFFRPIKPIHFLIANDRAGNLPVADNLADNDNLWVRVDHRTGASTTGDMADLGNVDTDVNGDGFVNRFDRLLQSRGVADTGQSANQ